MKKRMSLLTALAVLTLAVTGCRERIGAERISNGGNTENKMNASAPSSNSSDSGTGITEEEAKSIALADAGVQEADLGNIRIEKDSDDGVLVYDVDFYVGNKEYDYEIDATTGSIVSQDFEIEHDFRDEPNNAASADGLLSKADASKIVLSKVEGATEQHVRIQLDRDDGQDVYEGEIHYNGVEYEFELNAKTGDILEWSQEREDD